MAKGVHIQDEMAGIIEEEKKIPEEKTRKEQENKQESIYTAKEFANNARKLFDTRSECVAAALKSAKKESCSISEAKEIIKTFMKKEIK